MQTLSHRIKSSSIFFTQPRGRWGKGGGTNGQKSR